MAELPRVEIGVFGGSGFYELLDNPKEYRVNTPFGPPSSPVMVGEIGGRTVAFLPRHGKDHSASAARDQLPCERLGDEGAGCDPDHRSERVRFAAEARRARALRHLRPVRRSHERPQGHLLRRADHHARLLGRPVLPDDAPGRHRHRGRTRDHGAPIGHGRGHPRAAVLDPCGVEVVRLSGLGGHQHDPVPRVLPRP